MRGERTIELPEFEFSQGGEFRKATSITVRAPGFKKRAIHAAMSGYVSEGLIGVAKKVQGMSGDTDAEARAAEPDAVALMSMGLGSKYPDFHEVALRAITNSPTIACVSDTDVPITDSVWESIEQAGGMAAVDKVVSGFTSFFLDPAFAGSTKPNGSSLQAGS
jgi:hypothetical protein